MQGFSKEQWREVFSQITGGTGELDKAGLKHFMTAANGREPTPSEVSEEFTKIDAGGDGIIDEADFLRCYCRPVSQKSSDAESDGGNEFRNRHASLASLRADVEEKRIRIEEEEESDPEEEEEPLKQEKDLQEELIHLENQLDEERTKAQEAQAELERLQREQEADTRHIREEAHQHAIRELMSELTTSESQISELVQENEALKEQHAEDVQRLTMEADMKANAGLQFAQSLMGHATRGQSPGSDFAGGGRAHTLWGNLRKGVMRKPSFRRSRASEIGGGEAVNGEKLQDIENMIKEFADVVVGMPEQVANEAAQQCVEGIQEKLDIVKDTLQRQMSELLQDAGGQGSSQTDTSAALDRIGENISLEFAMVEERICAGIRTNMTNLIDELQDQRREGFEDSRRLAKENLQTLLASMRGDFKNAIQQELSKLEETHETANSIMAAVGKLSPHMQELHDETKGAFKDSVAGALTDAGVVTVDDLKSLAEKLQERLGESDVRRDATVDVLRNEVSNALNKVMEESGAKQIEFLRQEVVSAIQNGGDGRLETFRAEIKQHVEAIRTAAVQGVAFTAEVDSGVGPIADAIGNAILLEVTHVMQALQQLRDDVAAGKLQGPASNVASDKLADELANLKQELKGFTTESFVQQLGDLKDELQSNSGADVLLGELQKRNDNSQQCLKEIGKLKEMQGSVGDKMFSELQKVKEQMSDVIEVKSQMNDEFRAKPGFECRRCTRQQDEELQKIRKWKQETLDRSEDLARQIADETRWLHIAEQAAKASHEVREKLFEVQQTVQNIGADHCTNLERRGNAVIPESRHRLVRPGRKYCLASFPGCCGREYFRMPESVGSIACVFLTSFGIGRHVENPDDSEHRCYCHALYGKPQLYGCHWFKMWTANVERAVKANQTLVVFFFEGQCRQGMAEWQDLPSAPSSGIGLGQSQKCEVAWLRKRGYHFECWGMEDWQYFLRHCAPAMLLDTAMVEPEELVALDKLAEQDHAQVHELENIIWHRCIVEEASKLSCGVKHELELRGWRAMDIVQQAEQQSAEPESEIGPETPATGLTVQHTPRHPRGAPIAEEESLTLKFEAVDLHRVDKQGFTQELLKGFHSLGVPWSVASQLNVQIFGDSATAGVTGAASVVREIQAQLSKRLLFVMGTSATLVQFPSQAAFSTWIWAPLLAAARRSILVRTPFADTTGIYVECGRCGGSAAFRRMDIYRGVRLMEPDMWLYKYRGLYWAIGDGLGGAEACYAARESLEALPELAVWPQGVIACELKPVQAHEAPEFIRVWTPFPGLDGGFVRAADDYEDYPVYVGEQGLKSLWHARAQGVWMLSDSVGDAGAYNTALSDEVDPSRISPASWQTQPFSIEVFDCDALPRDIDGFVDMGFPPVASSVALEIRSQIFCWVRASVICIDQAEANRSLASVSPTPLFSDVHPNDCLQEAHADARFAAAIAAMAEFPSTIEALFQPWGLSPDGRYTVSLFDVRVSEWRLLTIDDLVPCQANGATLFTRPCSSALWMHLVEKALAKLFGCYVDCIGEHVALVWQALTGCSEQVCYCRDAEEAVWKKCAVDITRQRDMILADRLACPFTLTREEANDDMIFDVIHNLQKANVPMAAVISSRPAGAGCRSNGLLDGHAYTIIRVAAVGELRLLQLRNPWGTEEWTGDWGRCSPMWIWKPELACTLGFTGELDGLFWMSLEDFVAIFDCIYVSPAPMPTQRGNHQTLRCKPWVSPANFEDERGMPSRSSLVLEPSREYSPQRWAVASTPATAMGGGQMRDSAYGRSGDNQCAQNTPCASTGAAAALQSLLVASPASRTSVVRSLGISFDTDAADTETATPTLAVQLQAIRLQTEKLLQQSAVVEELRDSVLQQLHSEEQSPVSAGASRSSAQPAAGIANEGVARETYSDADLANGATPLSAHAQELLQVRKLQQTLEAKQRELTAALRLHHSAAVATVTTATSEAGATRLKVRSTEGFSLGMQILIGGLERRTIVALDSFVIDKPLQRPYPPNTSVAALSWASVASPPRQQRERVEGCRAGGGANREDAVPESEFKPLAHLAVCPMPWKLPPSAVPREQSKQDAVPHLEGLYQTPLPWKMDNPPPLDLPRESQGLTDLANKPMPWKFHPPDDQAEQPSEKPPESGEDAVLAPVANRPGSTVQHRCVEASAAEARSLVAPRDGGPRGDEFAGVPKETPVRFHDIHMQLNETLINLQRHSLYLEEREEVDSDVAMHEEQEREADELKRKLVEELSVLKAGDERDFDEMQQHSSLPMDHVVQKWQQEITRKTEWDRHQLLTQEHQDGKLQEQVLRMRFQPIHALLQQQQIHYHEMGIARDTDTLEDSRTASLLLPPLATADSIQSGPPPPEAALELSHLHEHLQDRLQRLDSLELGVQMLPPQRSNSPRPGQELAGDEAERAHREQFLTSIAPGPKARIPLPPPTWEGLNSALAPHGFGDSTQHRDMHQGAIVAFTLPVGDDGSPPHQRQDPIEISHGVTLVDNGAGYVDGRPPVIAARESHGAYDGHRTSLPTAASLTATLRSPASGSDVASSPTLDSSSMEESRWWQQQQQSLVEESPTLQGVVPRLHEATLPDQLRDPFLSSRSLPSGASSVLSDPGSLRFDAAPMQFRSGFSQGASGAPAVRRPSFCRPTPVGGAAASAEASEPMLNASAVGLADATFTDL